MTLIKIVVPFLIFSTFSINSNCQQYSETSFPKLGDTIADYTFTNLINHYESKASLSDFRGKWLILDYWSNSCLSCLLSFPKMNELHKKYNDDVKIVMIGGFLDDIESPYSEKATKATFEAQNQRYKLSFLVAFDNILSEVHDVYSLPHILVIDPSGVLVARTSNINSLQIDELLAGRAPHFEIALSKTEKEERSIFFNEELPVLTTGMLSNGGVDTSFYYRSLLAPYDKRNMPYDSGFNFETPRLRAKAEKCIENGRIEVKGVTAEDLYRLAYFGLNFWSTHDEQYGKYSYNLKVISKRKADLGEDGPRYVYSLSVPKSKSTEEYLLQCMREDLKRYFGYNAKKQITSMPVLYLQISDKNRVKNHKNTTGITTFTKFESIYEGHEGTNISLKSLITYISPQLFRLHHLETFDKTNVDFSMDISIRNNSMLEPKNLEGELNKMGFQIVKGKRRMQTIVLSDNSN